MARHFVLLHGAWHGGWCWEGVKRALEQAGYTADAPTMPGHAPDDERVGVALDTYVSRIVEVLEGQPEPVVLVGHASAGSLLQAAAPQAPEKIERLVFLNAFILADGTCQFDFFYPEIAAAMRAVARASRDNCVPALRGYVQDLLMAGEPFELLEALMERLVRQPVALFTSQVSTGAFRELEVPMTVVLCKDDVTLPSGAFLEMAQNLGDYELIELAGGHEALFTRPEAVAQGLLKAVNGRH